MVAKARRRSTANTKKGGGLIRGLAVSKYNVLARMVRLGETTWEELEAKGIVQPPKRESAYRREVKAKLGK